MQYILKIDCPDEKGLVHKISGILFSHGLNMTENEEFVDQERSHFFMRSEFIGKLDRDKVLHEVREILPPQANVELFQKHKKDIIIFATKEYHCLGDLLVRHQFGELNANIKAVISNHEYLGEFVEKFDIPFHYISAKDLEREEHEKIVLHKVQEYDPEFLVLAKYMRIFTSDFTRHFPDKIINIHHSFLPAFIGAKPYAQAYARGVKMVGATAHFVNENLDEGPIINQDVVQTTHKMDAISMARAGRDVEKIVLANALKMVFDDRVFVVGNRTVIL